MPTRKKTATVDLKVRMREPLRARLEAAAKDRGVSMNSEAVGRLEESFRSESLLPHILDLAYGPKTAGLLLLLGLCIKDTSAYVAVVQVGSTSAADNWVCDPPAYDVGVEAIYRVLEVLRPVGKPKRRNMAPTKGLPQPLSTSIPLLGRGIADGVLNEIINPASSNGSRSAIEPVRERLACLLPLERHGDAR
jgi:hypothetical protein